MTARSAHQAGRGGRALLVGVRYTAMVLSGSARHELGASTSQNLARADNIRHRRAELMGDHKCLKKVCLVA